MTHARIAATSLFLTALLAAAGCSPPTETKAPEAAVAPTTSPDVHRIKIGSLEAVALREGGMMVPNDNKVLGVGRTKEEVAAVLTANGMGADGIPLSIQPLFLRVGQQLVLIDAGGGAAMGPDAGKLPASLRAAGVEPDQITDILISHSHGDHVGGLVDAAGALIFPNATIRMTAAEWKFMQANGDLAAVTRAIAPRVETFQPGALVAPGITAVAIDGHTPGHTGYEIASGTDRLLYIGDTMHSSVISVQRPDWRIAYDSDAPTAQASRKALLQRAADGNLRLYAVHFPYPGLGRVQRKDDGFVWVPES